MTVIATDITRLSHLVKHVYGPEFGYCTELVVVNDTAGTLAIGTVLGKVTATGKFKRAVETAVDGSKVAGAVVMTAQTIPGTTDTKVLAFIRGPMGVSKAGLVIDATYNDATKLGVLYANLETVGIQVLDAV